MITRRSFLTFGLSFLVLSFPTSASASGVPGGSRFDTLYAAWRALTPDQGLVATVHRFTIRRESATIVLEDGKLALCTPFEGTIFACVFEGSGMFSLDPPDAMERGQLRRTYETDSLRKPFTSLVLFCTDSTISAFRERLEFRNADLPRSFTSTLKDARALFGDPDEKPIPAELALGILEGTRSDQFMAILQHSDDRYPMVFSIDPSADEEASLMQARYGGTLTSPPILDPICQYRLSRLSAASYQLKTPYALLTYSLEYSIADNLDVQAHARVTLRTNKSHHRWLLFDLFEKLAVDSITNSAGEGLPFSRTDEGYALWVDGLHDRPAGFVDTLTLYYHGDLILQEQGITAVRDPYYWYPRGSVNSFGFLKKVPFDMTFHYPSDYALVATGKRLSSVRDGDVSTDQWKTIAPARNCTFVIGKFSSYRVAEPGYPPATIMYSAYADYGMEKNVSATVMNSLRFFGHVFGRCPVDSLCAVEAPMYGADAFPGLVRLSLGTFLRGGEPRADIELRAHEVAHQWWGISLDFSSYRDQWLSEGFAEYSAWWMVLMALQDPKEFFGLLNRARTSIMSARTYLFADGQATGPIALGIRNESTQTRGDYARIVYAKGAWVIHMIRSLLLDPTTLDDTRFVNLLRSFYATYAGGRATTADFQRAVEKQTGRDMSWFFNQWVYGTDIPTYTFRSSTSRNDAGQYVVHCTVSGTGIGEQFEAPMLIGVRFEDDSYARVRVTIKGPHCAFDLPPSSKEPAEVIFNDLRSVLCEEE